MKNFWRDEAAAAWFAGLVAFAALLVSLFAPGGLDVFLKARGDHKPEEQKLDSDVKVCPDGKPPGYLGFCSFAFNRAEASSENSK